MTESSTPALECAGLRKSFGDVPAVHDVSLEVRPGELLALLGPSGCGKTTTLRLIAGFERADAGTVRIGGRTVLDARNSLPPESRRVGIVFQDYALFPHLSVGANVAYGLDRPASPQGAGGAGSRLAGMAHRYLPRSPRGGDPRVAEALALVSLGGLADRYPHELSGGEAQRVALARALAPRPELILLDEPFSNLDSRLRVAVRAEVRAILKRAGAAAVFVTHDQEEAFSLADRVAVMWEGRVAQVGTPSEIYRRPATRAVAAFVGDADFLPGAIENGVVRTEIGPMHPADAAGMDGPVEVMLRPEAVQVREQPPIDAADDWVWGEVSAHEYYGHDQMIRVRLRSGGQVHARLGPEAAHAMGDRVWVRAQGPVVVFAAADD
ncbi:MAG: iron(III) transport system ATP-binding protein [Chloroflexi bacterium]|nr:MAG: iron(III) transport system ATP-binding protein [Chloroflexota bacterium]